MSFPNKNQSVQCDVRSCKHHTPPPPPPPDVIKVAPRGNCHTGTCDESECASYHAR